MHFRGCQVCKPEGLLGRNDYFYREGSASLEGWGRKSHLGRGGREEGRKG